MTLFAHFCTPKILRGFYSELYVPKTDQSDTYHTLYVPKTPPAGTLSP